MGAKTIELQPKNTPVATHSRKYFNNVLRNKIFAFFWKSHHCCPIADQLSCLLFQTIEPPAALSIMIWSFEMFREMLQNKPIIGFNGRSRCDLEECFLVGQSTPDLRPNNLWHLKMIFLWWFYCETHKMTFAGDSFVIKRTRRYQR